MFISIWYSTTNTLLVLDNFISNIIHRLFEVNQTVWNLLCYLKSIYCDISSHIHERSELLSLRSSEARKHQMEVSRFGQLQEFRKVDCSLQSLCMLSRESMQQSGWVLPLPTCSICIIIMLLRKCNTDRK